MAAVGRLDPFAIEQPGRRLDGNRVELLAGVLGDDKPDFRGHGDRYRQESEREGSRCLLQRDSSERPQHISHEESDKPHDAVGA